MDCIENEANEMREEIEQKQKLIDAMVASSMMIDDIMVNDEDFFTVFTRLSRDNGKWITSVSYHEHMIKKKEHHSFVDAYKYHLQAIETLNAVGTM